MNVTFLGEQLPNPEVWYARTDRETLSSAQIFDIFEAT